MCAPGCLSHYILLFRSFVALSSRYPSQATWTRRLGCLGRMCSLPPSFLLTRCHQSATFQSSSFKPFSLFPHDTLHKQPWRAALVTSVGPTRGFSSRLVALVNRLSSVLDFRKAWLASFFCRRGALCIFLGEYQFYFIFDMIYASTLSSRSDPVVLSTV